MLFDSANESLEDDELTRIFLGLSAFTLVVLLYLCVDGFLIGDYQSVTDDIRSAKKALRQAQASGDDSADIQAQHDAALSDFEVSQGKSSWHMLMGTAALMMGLLVSCLSITYFVGTGRWCLEVIETYKLDPDYHDQSKRIKWRNNLWSLAGVTVLIVLAATGPACDPLANVEGNPRFWVAPHQIISIVGTLFVGVAFAFQYFAISSHYEVTGKILEDVRRIREEKGLDPDSDEESVGDDTTPNADAANQ